MIGIVCAAINVYMGVFNLQIKAPAWVIAMNFSIATFCGLYGVARIIHVGF